MHTANTHKPARARTHSPLARTHNHHAGSVLLRTQFHTRYSFSPRSSLHHHSTYTALLSFTQTSNAVPTATARGGTGGLAARMAPFSSSVRVPTTLFLAGHYFFLLASHCAARHTPARMHARSLTHARTADERTTRRANRRRGWLDQSLHEGGIRSARTLTAAAGPSPCGPYRHTLTMRPPLKARPLVF